MGWDLTAESPDSLKPPYLKKNLTVFAAKNYTIIHWKVAAGKKLATDFVQKCSKDFALT